MGKYYDGTKLLSMLDLNGNKPEIYMCTTNRTGGKTTYFARLCVNRFFDKKEKFCLVYRYNYELDDCAEKFYKDISGLFFKGTTMTSKRRAAGIFHELFIDDISCGYAVSLNSADQLKKYSHLFSDVKRMMFDEFQSETNHYCADEIRKFVSVHTSIARGQGEQIRYVPVYMCANPVSIAKNDYVAYSSECVYLNDNKAFVEKPYGANRYLATLRYKGTDYAIREYAECGVIYCDDRPDNSFGMKLTVTTDDHKINYVMLKRNSFFLTNMRYFFEQGCFRFKDLRCKEAVLKALSY